MRGKRRSCCSVVIVGSVLLWMAGCFLSMGGIRINTTGSMPVGFYKVVSGNVGYDSIVMFCPPNTAVFRLAYERGYISAGGCPGALGYMVKRVAALAGDAVVVRRDGVYVNGSLQPRSALRSADGAGRPLPRWREAYVVGQDDVLLLTDGHATSFDGRYFGPLSRSQIRWILKPLLTW